MAAKAPVAPAPPGPLASVRGFPASRGTRLLDLDIAHGDVILLTGPNGSGKTSLLRSLAGLSAPLQPASVHVAGRDPRQIPAKDLAAAVGVALQDPRESLVGLTVRSEFRLRGLAVPATAAAWTDRDVATLSSGEARRVSLSVAEATAAPLLLLDEPTEGLDAAARQRLLALVAAARRRGAVVAADHDGLLEAVATRRVALGDQAVAPARAIPNPGGPVLLRAPDHAIRLGDARGPRLRLPAVNLPAGLHAIAGPNGSGKSTLLVRLAGLRHATGVTLRGARPGPGRDSRLLLPHAGDLFTQPTVAAEIEGAEATVAAGIDGGLVPERLLHRHPLSLSAGEAERVALAKTLGRPAPLYLLDEPEAHLDAAGRALLLELIADRVAQGAVVVVATHDAGLLALAHSVVHLAGPEAEAP